MSLIVSINYNDIEFQLLLHLFIFPFYPSQLLVFHPTPLSCKIITTVIKILDIFYGLFDRGTLEGIQREAGYRYPTWAYPTSI